MTLWRVRKHYCINSDRPIYDVMPYNLKGHLFCCWKWYGIGGLKWCYLSKKLAEHKAAELNNTKES